MDLFVHFFRIKRIAISAHMLPRTTTFFSNLPTQSMLFSMQRHEDVSKHAHS